jgi:serine/threonine protein kinase
MERYIDNDILPDLTNVLHGLKSEWISTQKPTLAGEIHVQPHPYVASDFTHLKDLGEGTYGRVFSVLTKQGTTLVVKMIPKGSATPEEVESEVSVLQHLQHS